MSLDGDDAAVIVVGGGHAGLEAALASARLGVATVLVTGDPERICTLPCNPSIGGSAKGQLVREIDALGGEMGLLIDASSLHVRFLNESKGPAVRALRAQADKPRYAQLARERIAQTPNLQLVTGLVDDIDVEHGAVAGVRCSNGVRVRGKNVVLATGTFLGGKIYRGEHSEAAGRFGEAPALGLSLTLARLGFPLARLKTGTPPRIARDSIDRSVMQRQDPSEIPLPFSYRSEAVFAGPQLPCYIVQTSERTHALVRENLHRSPLYGLDLIRGIGPRYCPSIEDKVIKFAHNPSHQVFLEPEGWDEPTLYVGGFSTSLPEDVQLAMLRSLPGCADVVMLRAGYAVEYDYVPPTELSASLETRRIAGLFHCGQLNGTSGYEEAAAQGLLAGINAAQRARGQQALLLNRSSSYLGTMIDDLTSKGVDEPYRMLTSRAEHRLLLRHDNADTRLTPIGYQLGLLSESLYENFLQRQEQIRAGIARVRAQRLGLRQLHGLDFAAGATVADAIRRQEIPIPTLTETLGEADAPLFERIAIELRCEGYVRRQELAIARAQRDEETVIPDGLDYAQLHGLSREARERLAVMQPATMGAASRLRGVTPADMAVLAVYVHRATQLLGVAAHD